MIKHINIKYLMPIACLVFLLNSCDEDILESTPFAQSTSAGFWRNADDAIAAANAMYRPLTTEDLYGHNENVFDNCSDDIYRAGDHGYEPAMENFTMDASNKGIRVGWKPNMKLLTGPIRC